MKREALMRTPWLPLVLLAIFVTVMGVSFAPEIVSGERTSMPDLSNRPLDNLWITNERVLHLEAVGDLLYIVGWFDRVGPHTGLAAPFNTNNGALLPNFPRLDGDWNADVRAIVPDGSGGWYIGGEFLTVDGMPLRNLAHIHADYSLDQTWKPDPNGPVYALLVSDGTLYVGGDFTTIGEQERQRIVALDVDTGALTSWNPAADSTVRAMAVSGNALYVGGYFQQIGGEPRAYAAALDRANGQVSDWNPLSNGPVLTMVVSGTTVYAGGYFSQIGWRSRTSIAALDATTGQALNWSAGLSGSYPTVSALTVSGNTVYVGGYFERVNNSLCAHLVFLDANTGSVRRCPGVDADGGVYALALSGDTLYVGGRFAGIAGQPRTHLAALDASTGAVKEWNPAPDCPVRALVLGGDTLYAGGCFRSSAMLLRDGLAAIHIPDGRPTTWTPPDIGGGECAVLCHQRHHHLHRRRF